MRCTATVRDDQAIGRRALSNNDPQCLREAVEGTLCRQHAGVRWCRARGCDRQAVAQEGEWWFCRTHRRLWAEHNAIVQRITAFRPRA
jgi:hypothetical protein